MDLEELLRVHGVALDVVDERVTGAPLDFRFQGKLTDVQEAAARALLAHDTGVLVAPLGVGKTVIGTYLVPARACSTLILVHRRPLLDQWLAQLARELEASGWRTPATSSGSTPRAGTAVPSEVVARAEPQVL
jgi:superfamily II DNA or RNA helicase